MGIDRTDLAVFVLASIVVLSRVIGPATIGLADNGDFGKISGAFGLHPAVADADSSFRYATIRYDRDPKFYWRSNFVSSESVVAFTAVALANLFGPTGEF